MVFQHLWGTKLALTVTNSFHSRHQPAADLRTRERAHAGRHHGQLDGSLLHARNEGHLQVQHQGQRGHRAQRKQVAKSLKHDQYRIHSN